MIGGLRRSRDGQEGVALLMLLIFMAAAVPVVYGALQTLSVVNIDSRVKTDLLESRYAALSGDQYARYRLAYEANYVDSLPMDTPVDFPLSINGKDVTVTILKTSEPPPAPSLPGSESGRELRTEMLVEPDTAPESVPTTFTYDITVTNSGADPADLTTFYALLPSSDFSYIASSTSGITTDEPLIVGNELMLGV